MVSSPCKVSQALDLRGIATVKIPADGLGPIEVEHALAFAKKAKPIFQGRVVDKDGNGIDEVEADGSLTGYFVSDYGTKQRRQRPIPDHGKGDDVLVKFRGESQTSKRADGAGRVLR